MTNKTIEYKYNKVLDEVFFRKLGKVVNVVGLTIESAGPDARLGDVCRIIPNGKEEGEPITAEVVGFKDKKTLLMPYDAVDGISLGSMVENTNGDHYYINSKGVVAAGERKYLYTSWMKCDLPAGWYTFDENGVLIDPAL